MIQIESFYRSICFVVTIVLILIHIIILLFYSGIGSMRIVLILIEIIAIRNFRRIFLLQRKIFEDFKTLLVKYLLEDQLFL